MIDEANRIGIQIDSSRLEQELGIPVVATTALSGKGIDELKTKLAACNHHGNNHQIDYGAPIE